jgi:hypothetical protein
MCTDYFKNHSRLSIRNDSNFTWAQEAESQPEEVVESLEAVLQSWVALHQEEVGIAEGVERIVLAFHLFKVYRMLRHGNKR